MDRWERIEECVPAKQFSQQDALTSRVGSSFRSLPTRHPDPPLFLSRHAGPLANVPCIADSRAPAFDASVSLLSSSGICDRLHVPKNYYRIVKCPSNLDCPEGLLVILPTLLFLFSFIA